MVEKALRRHRAAACIFDFLFLEACSWLLMLLVTALAWFYARNAQNYTGEFHDVLDPMVAQVIEGVLGLAISAPYYIVLQAKRGMTLGKWLFGVRVVGAQDFLPLSLKRSVGRYFAYLLSYLPLGAGFLMGFFQPQGKALHDLIAGTWCVKAPLGYQVVWQKFLGLKKKKT